MGQNVPASAILRFFPDRLVNFKRLAKKIKWRLFSSDIQKVIVLLAPHRNFLGHFIESPGFTSIDQAFRGEPRKLENNGPIERLAVLRTRKKFSCLWAVNRAARNRLLKRLSRNFDKNCASVSSWNNGVCFAHSASGIFVVQSIY